MKVLLLTQNIGSIECHGVCSHAGLPDSSMEERTTKWIRSVAAFLEERGNPDLFVLHLQEIGGKKFSFAFVQYLASVVSKCYPSACWCSGLLGNLETNYDQTFTALGTVVFVGSREVAEACALWSFRRQEFRPILVSEDNSEQRGLKPRSVKRKCDFVGERVLNEKGDNQQCFGTIVDFVVDSAGPHWLFVADYPEDPTPTKMNERELHHSRKRYAEDKPPDPRRNQRRSEYSFRDCCLGAKFSDAGTSRKGFLLTSLCLHGGTSNEKVLNFANLHLFHDADNTRAATQPFPSEYALRRTKAATEAIQSVSQSIRSITGVSAEWSPLFVFGDFNTRLDMHRFRSSAMVRGEDFAVKKKQIMASPRVWEHLLDPKSRREVMQLYDREPSYMIGTVKERTGMSLLEQPHLFEPTYLRRDFEEIPNKKKLVPWTTMRAKKITHSGGTFDTHDVHMTVLLDARSSRTLINRAFLPAIATQTGEPQTWTDTSCGTFGSLGTVSLVEVAFPAFGDLLTGLETDVTYVIDAPDCPYHVVLSWNYWRALEIDIDYDKNVITCDNISVPFEPQKEVHKSGLESLTNRYQTTRLPAWCDRVWYNPSANQLWSGDETNVVYNTADLYPMDHLPVYLQFCIPSMQQTVKRVRQEPSDAAERAKKKTKAAYNLPSGWSYANEESRDPSPVIFLTVGNIQGVPSSKHFAALLSSGRATTVINKSSLPYVLQFQSEIGSSVLIRGIAFPEFNNRTIREFRAEVFDDQDVCYDIIIGSDLLMTEMAMIMNFGNSTMSWSNLTVGMKEEPSGSVSITPF